MKKTILSLLLVGAALMSGEARASDCCTHEKPKVSWGFSLNFGPSLLNSGYYRHNYRPQKRVVVHHFPTATRPEPCCCESCYVREVHHVHHQTPVARPPVRTVNHTRYYHHGDYR